MYVDLVMETFFFFNMSPGSYEESDVSVVWYRGEAA